MVVPSKRTFDFFDLGYGYQIGNAVTFDNSDGILQLLVPVLNGYVFYKDRVGFRRFQRVQGVHVIIACSLLIDVDAIILNNAEINSIYANVTNELSSNLGAATRAAHKESEGQDTNNDNRFNTTIHFAKNWIKVLR